MRLLRLNKYHKLRLKAELEKTAIGLAIVLAICAVIGSMVGIALLCVHFVWARWVVGVILAYIILNGIGDGIVNGQRFFP